MLSDDETTAEKSTTKGIVRTTRIYKESDFEIFPFLPPETDSELQKLYAAANNVETTSRVWLIAQAIFYAICISLIIGIILLIVIAIYMAWKLHFDDD